MAISRIGRSELGACKRSPLMALICASRWFLMSAANANLGAQTIYEVDSGFQILNTGSLPNPTAGNPSTASLTSIGGDGANLWYLDQTTPSILAIDTNTFSTIASYSSPEANTGYTGNSTAYITGNADDVYVALGKATTAKLYRLNPNSSMAVVSSATISGNMTRQSGIALADGKVWILSRNDGKIYTYDAVTLALIASFSIASLSGLGAPVSIEVADNKIHVIKALTAANLNVYRLNMSGVLIDTIAADSSITERLHCICGGKK